jgi:hypothetical protein
MPACTVTSSAVVGSSATSSRGWQATAIAIITRCRMPPESWCGYSLSRREGSGMPTSSSSSVARRSAVLPRIAWCRRSTSRSCRPTVSTGLSEVIGSWNTYATSRPRTSRRRASERSRSERSPSRTEPVIAALVGSNRVSAIAVTLLPQPDSPTIASTSRSATSKSTPSTASTGPSSVRNCTVSSRTSSRAPPGAGDTARTDPPALEIVSRTGSLIAGSPAGRARPAGRPPSRFSDSVTTTMQMPGITASHGPDRNSGWALASITPSDGIGGRMPSRGTTAPPRR